MGSLISNVVAEILSQQTELRKHAAADTRMPHKTSM